MDNERVGRVARRALEILRDDGWNKGALTWLEGFPTFEGVSYQPGSHCIGGALNLAMCEDDLSLRTDNWRPGDETYEAVREVIAAQYPDFQLDMHGFAVKMYETVNFIARWNNQPERTIEDVESVLEKLAVR